MAALKASLFIGAVLAILCAPGWRPVLAQAAAPSQPADQPAELTEILVSAEKQATGRSIQKVPIAVTGVDASTIEQAHIQNIVDIGHLAPNVILDTSGTLPGTAAFTIRGVGERSSTASIDSAVSVSQDGMVLSLQTGLSMLGTFDTESVEILRGPQGVLQGVNAAGGAVTFTTPLPTDTFHASASVTTGNYNLIGTTATVEGPLSDNVLGKIAIFEQHVDGYYRNTTDEGTYVAAPGNPSGLPGLPGQLPGLGGFNPFKKSWRFTEMEASFIARALQTLLGILQIANPPRIQQAIDLRMDFTQCGLIIKHKLMGVQELRVAANIEHFNQSGYGRNVSLQEMDILNDAGISGNLPARTVAADKVHG